MPLNSREQITPQAVHTLDLLHCHCHTRACCSGELRQRDHLLVGGQGDKEADVTKASSPSTHERAQAMLRILQIHQPRPLITCHNNEQLKKRVPQKMSGRNPPPLRVCMPPGASATKQWQTRTHRPSAALGPSPHRPRVARRRRGRPPRGSR